MNKFKIAFLLSVLINICFVTYGFSLINGLGGLRYLKARYAGINTALEYKDRYAAKTSIFDNLKRGEKEILFIGDSMTDYGQWNEYFQGKNISNRGIAGDNIQGVINRIDASLQSQPDKIFLMIGINNISDDESTSSILTNYETLLNMIRLKSPKSRLYLQSILPNYGRNISINPEVIEVNKGLVILAKKYNASYVNLYDTFKDNHGDLKREYSNDGLHLTNTGYHIWQRQIDNLVAE